MLLGLSDSLSTGLKEDMEFNIENACAHFSLIL